MNNVTTAADDFHRHLRRPPLLQILLKYLGAFTRATIMPNPTGDVKNDSELIAYEQEIRSATPSGIKLEPLMTIKLTPKTTPDTILKAGRAGGVAAKFYPIGMTTGADNGVDAEELKKKDDWFAALVEANMLLLLHGEHNHSGKCLDREQDFLNVLRYIAYRFPGLRIVMEHITTSLSVDAVTSLPANVAATITPHHLYLTLNDIIGGLLHPHNFCKPVAKWEEDRVALINAAISGNRKFFCGTDDAAHFKGNKEGPNGCAGVFTGPLGPLFYAEQFDKADALDKLPDFLARWGAEYYQIPENKDRTVLVRKEMLIPQEYEGIVPFRGKRYLFSW